jgi:hypothetical protein
MPSDGKSSHCLWQGELKINFSKKCQCTDTLVHRRMDDTHYYNSPSTKCRKTKNKTSDMEDIFLFNFTVVSVDIPANL